VGLCLQPYELDEETLNGIQPVLDLAKDSSSARLKAEGFHGFYENDYGQTVLEVAVREWG
jgi:hypothetical protein